LKERVDWLDSTPWFAHPYCLAILRRELDDTSPTGGTYKIQNGQLLEEHSYLSFTREMPKLLENPTARRKEATARACDEALDKLGQLVVGLPPYHPLLKDADKRLGLAKAAFDRFTGNYRRATRREIEILDLSHWTPAYVPDIRPLGRAAAKGEVLAGKAVFHLGGKGKVADLELPAAAVWKRDAAENRPSRVIIVQAEIGPDGEVTCGVIARQQIQAVSARELLSVKSFAELDKEEKAATAQQRKKD
jgi:hypothetical protein